VSWANLDDRLHAHPKVQELQTMPSEGMMAFGLWAWSLSWCRAYSPDDGVIPVKAAALAWRADPELIRQLVDCLVEVDMAERGDRGDPTWAIHDWCDWQLSPQQRGGLSASRNASRTELGRFGPPAGDQPDGAGEPAEHQLSPASSQPVSAGPPAGHASPRLSTPRLSEPAKTVEEIRRLEVAAGYRPVPKPVRKKR
jgi:hypothetical protein